MVMKAHFANLPTAVWALIGLARAGGDSLRGDGQWCPQVVHAVVPEVVRTVLRSHLTGTADSTPPL